MRVSVKHRLSAKPTEQVPWALIRREPWFQGGAHGLIETSAVLADPPSTERSCARTSFHTGNGIEEGRGGVLPVRGPPAGGDAVLLPLRGELPRGDGGSRIARGRGRVLDGGLPV